MTKKDVINLLEIQQLKCDLDTPEGEAQWNILQDTIEEVKGYKEKDNAQV